MSGEHVDELGGVFDFRQRLGAQQDLLIRLIVILHHRVQLYIYRKVREYVTKVRKGVRKGVPKEEYEDFFFHRSGARRRQPFLLSIYNAKTMLVVIIITIIVVLYVAGFAAVYKCLARCSKASKRELRTTDRSSSSSMEEYVVSLVKSRR
jgi:hypothetical protein